jgi:hypothetical protein
MIIKSSNTSDKITIIDLNETISTNEYYKKLWKSKYNIDFHKKTDFKNDMVQYLKGNKAFIE